MKKRRELSPYARGLFESGRGEMLMRDFFRRLILAKRIPDHRVPHRDLYAKHREKVSHETDVAN